MAIAIRLSHELDERLSVLAQKTHRSKSYYVREALEHYIDDIEDYHLAMHVLENPGKIYTLEEVEKMCGLDD